jgi:hypothetical protein
MIQLPALREPAVPDCDAQNKQEFPPTGATLVALRTAVRGSALRFVHRSQIRLLIRQVCD